MSKRLLRGIIDFGDAKLTIEQIDGNYRRLLRSGFEWHNPDETKIWTYVQEYVQQNLEPPDWASIRDYFERNNEITVVEKLADIKTVEAYTRSNYGTLLRTLREEQAQNKVRKLLRDVEEIITRGRVEGKTQLKGVTHALQYFNQHVYEEVPRDHNIQIEGDIVHDTERVWTEYQDAKSQKDKAYGKFTGIDHIDKTCHGIKKGELWVHAAATGELKCLAGDTTVFDHRTQRRRRLSELYACGDLPVVSAIQNEGASPVLVQTPASHLVQNGRREIFELLLVSGRRIGATSNHKFLTPFGWESLSSLKEGDFVATPKVMRAVGARPYSLSEVKLVGYLIGDGAIGQCINFTQQDGPILCDFVTCLRDLGYIEGEPDYENPWFSLNVPQGGQRVPYVRVAHGLGDRWHRTVSPLRLLLEQLGLYGTDSYNKRIPSEFFGMSEDLVAALLGALWSTNGSCCTDDYVRKDRINKDGTGAKQSSHIITYSSVCRELCEDIQSLLLRLGIKSTVTFVNTKVEDRPYRFWTVRIVTNPSKRLFCEKVRIVGKEAKFSRLLSRLPKIDSTPVPSSLLPDGRRIKINGHWRYARTASRNNPTVTSDVAEKFGVSTGDIYWDCVKSVNSMGVEMTYDLSVPVHRTFVANDIITHNSSFAINWCYNLATRYRTHSLYVSLEMRYEHLRRLLAVMHTSNGKFTAQGRQPLDYRKVRDGDLTREEEAFYKEALHDLENNPEYHKIRVYSPDRKVGVDDIRVYAESVHRSMDVGLLVVDHSGLVKAARAHKDYTVEHNTVIVDAKLLALHFNGGTGLPVLLLHQINRQGKDAADKQEGTEKEGVYRFSNLSYANEAERSADYVTTTYLCDSLRAAGETIFCNLKNRDNDLFSKIKVKVDFANARRLRNLEGQESFNNKELTKEDLRLLNEAGL
jgi:intein/homing endonuclease